MAALACDTLYGFDSPRPALGRYDRFEVSPQCLDLPVDPSAVALVPTVVTITGRRGGSGLGAEAVPVSVSVGACADHEESHGSGGAAAGGAAGTDEDDESSEAVSGAGCTTAEPLNALDSARFELQAIEARGCRQRSPSRLDCTLDASGEAAFGVASRIQDAFNLTGYLPICVRPHELQNDSGSDGRSKARELAVLPRVGSSRVALAVLRAGEEPAPPFENGARCDSVLACESTRVRARFQVGAVSADLPASTIRVEDFRPVTRNVSLTALLRVTNASASGATPFLTTDSSCDRPPQRSANGGAGGDDGEADDAGVLLELRAGQSGSDIVYLCASGFAAAVEVTAALADAGAGMVNVIAERSELLPLNRAYTTQAVGADEVLFSERCGEQAQPVPPAGVRIDSSTGLTVSSDGQRVVATCPGSRADGAGGADASAGGSGGEAPETTPATLGCSLTLSVSPAGTCTLEVEP